MELWTNIAIVVHVVIALAIIGLVLLQHGKGADMGSGFGTGSSGSLFGASGSANFLSRMTAVLATLFFLTSLGLAYLATNKPRAGGGVLDAAKSAPAKPGAQPAKDGAKPAGDVPSVPGVPGVPNATNVPSVPGASTAPEAAKDGATKGKEVPN